MSQRHTLTFLVSTAVVGAVVGAPWLSAPRGSPWAVTWGATALQPATRPAAGDEPDEPETEVVLTDGRRVTGVLIERTEKDVILRISGIPTPFPVDTVAQVKTGLSVAERYREMRKTIDDSDVGQRLRLAEWLRARRKYRLAFEEVTGVLALEPGNPEAKHLQLWLSEQLKLVPREQPPRPAPEPNAEKPAPPTPAPTKPTFPVLTPEQINLIRVYEIDLNDPPRMLVDRDTITALLTQHVGDPAVPDTREGRDAIYRKRPSQILELMFQLKARDLYGRVQVQDDPTSMRLFRDRVHSTWLMNTCATNQCHGGQEAGRLWLTNKRPSADATVYTNFVILERFLLSPRPGAATPGGEPPRRLIDYDDPARSPLLQLGLPRKDSQFPHPQVLVGGRQRGFNPVFQTTEDRRFQEAVQWIRAMYRPHPDYPVQYDPPLPGGAPPPATPGNEPTKAAGER